MVADLETPYRYFPPRNSRDLKLTLPHYLHKPLSRMPNRNLITGIYQPYVWYFFGLGFKKCCDRQLTNHSIHTTRPHKEKTLTPHHQQRYMIPNTPINPQLTRILIPRNWLSCVTPFSFNHSTSPNTHLDPFCFLFLPPFSFPFFLSFLSFIPSFFFLLILDLFSVLLFL